MAKNESRSMSAEFTQGHIDRSYIQLCPDRGVVENVPVERLSWPTYTHAEMYQVNPFLESHLNRADLPREHKTTRGRLGYGS